MDSADAGGVEINEGLLSIPTPSPRLRAVGNFTRQGRGTKPAFNFLPDARAHFVGGFFGEGDGDERAQGDAVLDEVEIAPDERARFARPGPGGDGEVRVEAGGGLNLRAFEVKERKN